MGAADLIEEGFEADAPPAHLELAAEPVEIRRNPVVSGVLGVASAGVAIAYLARATQSSSALDWAAAVALGLLAGLWLRALVDARTPLLVADEQGVRIRLGRAWHGLPWGAVHHVEHEPRRTPLSDPRLVVVPHNEERFEADLDAAGRRQVRLSRRLHGAGLAVPLGLTTSVRGADGDLGAALARIAASPAQVVEVAPPGRADDSGAADADADATADAPTDALGEDARDVEPTAALDLTATEVADEAAAEAAADEGTAPWYAPAKARLAHWLVRLEEAAGTRDAERADAGPVDAGPVDAGQTGVAYEEESTEEAVDDVEATQQWRLEDLAEGRDSEDPAPAPVRTLQSARRHEITVDLPDEALDSTPLEGRELHRPGQVDLVEETQAWGDRVRPIARPGQSVEPLVIDDFTLAPAQDPVIGPELAAARTRLGLDVDQLAERTRIRPHVIESIEVDDFAPCGGDFYARGHLRTLARVLGVDSTELLQTYDQRYANAPVNPRRVFEAELATGVNGSIRSTRGGPNWSVLVAVVMAVVLCWSVARLVMDSPADLRPVQPVLNGSGGPGGSAGEALADPVAVHLAAPTGGAHVVVRDGAGEIVFRGSLAAGATQDVKAAPPVRVQSSDGSVTVALADGAAKAVGETGVAAQGTFVVR